MRDAVVFSDMVAAVVDNLAEAGTEPAGVVVADAGYWSPANAELDCGVEVLIAPGPTFSGITDPDDPRIEQRRQIIERLDRRELSVAEAARQIGLSTTTTRKMLNQHRSGLDPGRSRAEMQRRLATDTGAAAFAKRGTTVEPVFGHLKHNQRYRRFNRRGLAAVASEWKLIATAHNLAKLHRTRLATT